MKPLLTALLILFVAMTIAIGQAGAQGLSDLQQQHEFVMSERARVIDDLERLEGEYRALVARIDRLKSEGAMSRIAGRIELQEVLTQSKSLADRLDAMQEVLRTIDHRVRRQRGEISKAIDRRIADLEGSLAKRDAAGRRAAVAELNALRQQARAYREELPAGPSIGAVRSALEASEQVDDHPDELLAAADELQDTEDQIRRRLQAIDKRLSELRQAKALVRRARTFSREERFFEESDRDRVIARYDRVSKTPTGSDSGSSTVATSDKSAAGEYQAPSNEETDSLANNAAEPMAGAGGAADQDDSDGAEFAGAPAMDSDATANRSAGDPLVDAPSGASVSSGSPPAGGGDSFTTSRQTIVIGAGGDPSRAVGAQSGAASDLDGQIEQLETEQDKLEKQANALRKRAKRLRQRAEEL